MELNRVDYALLKVLLKNDSVSFFKGMTIYEILDILGGSRVTTYKKLNRLVKLGYVEKGCKDINADTYLLTAKGSISFSCIIKRCRIKFFRRFRNLNSNTKWVPIGSRSSK